MCDDTYVPLQKLGRNVEKDPLGIDSRVALQISVEKLGPFCILYSVFQEVTHAQSTESRGKGPSN